jgi:hypothetical protein
MGVFDIEPANNPQAYGVMSYGVEGGSTGWQVDTNGLMTALGGMDGIASPIRMPKYVQASQILTQFQSGHGWTNNAGSTFTANYTTSFALGTQCCQIVTGGAGVQANVSKTGMSAFDCTSKALRVRFNIPDLTHVAEFGFFVGDTNFANNYKWSAYVGGSKFAQSGDWVEMTLSFHDATTTGSPNRASLTDARFYIRDDNTGNTVSALWQSFELIPDGSSAFPNGVISICFDDSYASQWSAAKPSMDAKGYPGTLYTIDDYIGTSGRLTLAQLKIMHDLCGWEVAAHAHTGTAHSASYTGLTAQQLLTDIRQQRAQLSNWGLRDSDGTAYPLGQFGLTSDGQQTSDIVRPVWGYARTTSSRVKETWPPADRYRLRAISAISSFAGGYAPSTLTTATTGDIDKCKAQKSWLILVFHDITAGAAGSTTQCSQADFDSILTAIAAAGVPVMTVADVLKTA